MPPFYYEERDRGEIMKNIQLIALDMDGTLYNSQGEISPKDIETLKKAVNAGVSVAVATGRAYSELPVDMLYEVGVRYAITGNGSGVYRLPDKECVFADCLETEVLLQILEELKQLDVYYDVYIDGLVYCPKAVCHNIRKMDMPESIYDHIERTRIFVDDLSKVVKNQGKKVEKATINFALLPDGTYLDRENTAQLLSRYPQVQYLCGGYHNLEFTRAGVTKGSGLKFLAEQLGVSLENVMACGDSENDIFMLEAAGVGVAMANAEEEVKASADFITRSNDENGVAYAVESLVFGFVD